MSKLNIPFTGLPRQYQALRTEILDVTDQVLSSGRVMSDVWTQRLELWLRQRNSREYAITCHSGTQALEIIAEYFWEWHRDELPRALIPALTFPATANAFIRAGWEIELIDVDRYGMIDFSRITPEQRQATALCAVGLFGQAIPEEIHYHAEHVIEDAAQHWLANQCQRTGSSAAISFDPTKNLGNYGNGGAVITQDRQLADFARDWVMHGKRGGHNEVGSNSRMSEVDCAQLMIKTQYIDQWQQRRRDISRYWMQRFEHSSVRCLIDDSNFDQHCFHKFVIDVDQRDHLAAHLKIAGIETKVHYEHPLWELPVFEHMYRGEAFLGVASALSRRCLSLPIYPELTDSEVEYIASQVLVHASSKHN